MCGVIAAQTATIQAGFIAASGATLVEFATPDETIQAVRNGEADAVLADGDYLLPIVGESNGELEVVGQESIGGGIGMGIRESDGDLKAKMDKAIGTMKADGTLNTMSKRERLQVSRQRAKLEKNLGSISDMNRIPAAVFIVDVMKELPATLVMRPFNFDTLAVQAHHLAADERLAEAALPSLAIVVVGIPPLILLSRAIARGRPGSRPQTQQGDQMAAPPPDRI